MIRGRVVGLMLAASAAATASFTARVAHGFTEPRTYAANPREGGGGGRWFTGSPAEGHGCSVCHTGPQAVRVEVEGLPQAGYVPGEQYALRLSWPAFAARADALREQGEGPPAMGLVAELVAASGGGSGTIEIASADDAVDDELCVLPEGAPATQLFGARPGDPAEEEGTHCIADALGERCLATVLSCGARELRLRWTAPANDEGAVWFAAGFVATEHAHGDAEGDAVTEISIVVPPAASGAAVHEMDLHRGCAVIGGPRATPTGGAGWLVLACVGGWLARRGRAVSAWRVVALALVVPGLGCADEPGDFSLAGLYTPGTTLGDVAGPEDDAGLDGGGLSEAEQRALEDSITEASEQDRCSALSGDEGTPGSFVAEFTTASYGGFYEPANCGAVWIEDTEGAYVATSHVWAEMRLRNLFVWDARRCKDGLPVDAIATATLADHSQSHVARWDGRDQTGRIAPDGPYVLNVEVTEDELDFGRRTQIPFDKGSTPYVLEPEGSETVLDVRIEWVPSGAGP